MNVVIPKETLDNESRVAATPGSIKELVKAGLSVMVETQAGIQSHIYDTDYKNAGASIIESKEEKDIYMLIILFPIMIVAPKVPVSITDRRERLYNE